MKSHSFYKEPQGFTLVEIMTVTALIVIVGGICLMTLGQIKDRSDAAKLRSDVASLNSSVRMFQASGGSVPETTDHLAVLARLKSTVTEEQETTHVGLRGTLLDSRVTVQMMTEEEESSSDPRAVWNNANKKFQIAYSGGGIKRFVLGEVVAATQGLRNSTVKYSTVNDWVWDYRDSSTDRGDYSAGYSTSEEVPEFPTDEFGNPLPPSWSSPDTLNPPYISLPTGFYEAASYPLSVTLINPNPEGSSTIYYAFDGGDFRPYFGSSIDVAITFSTTILAYAKALDPDYWTDSTASSAVYETLYISGDVHGEFTPPSGGTANNAVQQLETTDEYSKFTWGRPQDMSDHTASSLTFTGEEFSEIVPDSDFVLGTLSYYNGGNHGSTGVDELDLVLDLQLTVNIPIADENLLLTFDVITTPDHKWASEDENSDYVEMLAFSHEFVTTLNGVIYYLVISFDYVQGDAYIDGNEFHVHEDGTGEVKIIALLTPDPDGLDNTVPTVNLAYTYSLTAGTEQDPHLITGPVALDVTFSEVVTGFALSDVHINGGTVNTVTGSGMNYVVSMTPNGSGLINANIAPGSVLDTVGHTNLISNVVYFYNDQIPPGLEITVDSTEVFANFWADITASESVTGFTFNDIDVTNGSVVSFGFDGMTYTAEIEPVAVGDIEISIPAGVLTDQLGNENLASNTVTVLYRLPDITPPTPTLAYSGGTQPVPGCADVVINVRTDDYAGETSWTLTNSNNVVVASYASYSDQDTDYAHDYCLPSGDYSLTIEDSYGDGICCAYGNGSYSVSVYGSTVVSGGSFGSSESTDFTITTIDPFYVTGPVSVALAFDEDIVGLTIDDLSVSNGTVTSFAGSGAAYTFTATPDGGSSPMSIELPSNVVDDLSGNGNAGSNVLYLEIDSVSPSIEFSTAALNVDAAFQVTGLGSEALIGLTAADISVTNGVLSGFSETGALYGFTITPTTFGTVSVHVPANLYTDLAGNTGTVSNTLEVEFVEILYLNFDVHVVGSFGSNAGTHSVSNGGLTLKIEDNAWKKINYSYTVTENTVIEFEFRSSRQGEIHGIGFDDNLLPSSTLTMQLYGTQNWGVNTYQNYSDGDGWKSYSIPIGQEYTGDFNYLFFVADHDQSPSNGKSEFRNVRVYEQ